MIGVLHNSNSLISLLSLFIMSMFVYQRFPQKICCSMDPDLLPICLCTKFYIKWPYKAHRSCSIE